jgi:hypothetical protein
VLLVVGINSCQVSSRNSALRSYEDSVSSLVQQSTATSSSLFHELSSIGGATNATGARHAIATTGLSAQKLVQQARGLSVPDQMGTAQADFVRALQMRSAGIQTIAANIESALGTSAPQDSLNRIAGAMAQFYASDVLYTDYAAREIAVTLNGAGVGTGQGVQAGQFLPSLAWLSVPGIGQAINANVPTQTTQTCPSSCGDAIDSVAVSGTTLSPTAANQVAGSPAPTFVLSFTNDGTNPETGTRCEVTLSGSTIGGHGSVAQTTAGETTTCSATLSSAPPPGQYTVKATIEKVAGEHNLSNNSLTFHVTFT